MSRKNKIYVQCFMLFVVHSAFVCQTQWCGACTNRNKRLQCKGGANVLLEALSSNLASPAAATCCMDLMLIIA